MTRLMDKLATKSYIERSRSEGDRRTVYSEITEPGLKLLAEIDNMRIELPLQHLSEQDVKMINELMDKVRL